MAFLDVLGKKITQTGQDVVQKTKDTAEVIKYNSMVAEEERRILLQFLYTYSLSQDHGK